MVDFNVICGLPRTGSTLLCNILHQNPRFHVSSTSCTAQTVQTLQKHWSKAPEIKSESIVDKDGTQDRMRQSVKAMILGWYEDKGPVVFDKCRPWNHSALVLRQLFPNSNMFVLVRDLRVIFASLEKRHKENPLMDSAKSPLEMLMDNRADRAFDRKTGVVGQNLLGVEDLIRLNIPNTTFIKYEDFVQDPQATINTIYTALREKPYDHDFENVVNESTDVDALFLEKYPHSGSGKVAPPIDDTAKHVAPDIMERIMSGFPIYNEAFGYK